MRIAVTLLLLLWASNGCSASTSVDERIPLEPGGLLEVDLDYGVGLRPDPGFLEVSAHDLDEVRILGEASGWGSADVVFRVDTSGESSARSVRLVGGVRGASAWLFGGPQVRVRIRVPRESALDLRCSAGPIRVEDIRGPVRARTGNASIEVSGVEGPVKLRTNQGAIRVSDSVGSVRVKASEGDIDLRWVRGDVEARTGGGSVRAAHITGRFQVRTDDGDVEIDGAGGPVEVKTERGNVVVRFDVEPQGSIETRNGSLDIAIPVAFGAELRAESRRGSVEFGNGIAFEGLRDTASATGRVGAGGLPLRLYTARGTVRVTLR